MGLRINHNLASLNASLNLGKANSLLSKSLQRLSTGLRINTAADGPADLIISEKFRAQIRSLSQATENTQTAISMLSTAEGALTEVNSLLVKMKGLALKAAQTGTADSDEIAASQSEIDAALQSINSISRNTSFGTKFLLDGSLDISSTEVDTDKIRVDMEKANFAGDVKRLTVNVNSASVQAENKVLLNSAGTLTVGQTLKITGTRGSSTIQFAAGAAGADIAKEINDQTTQTNVTAAYDSINKEVVFKSVEYGATEFVTVEDVDGTNDILKGQLGEKLTAATLEYGSQFKILAKNAGTEGNKISFRFNEATTSTTSGISINQDASTGATNVTISLEDEGTSFYGVSARFSEFNKNIDTTLSEIKSLIESNAVLNDLVDFSLESGASLTDKVSVDSSFTNGAKFLTGGASGEAAVASSLTLTGASAALSAATNANNITFTAKTAGAGGNDIKILFSETGSALSTLAINSLGSAFSQSSGYFSADNGTSQIFMKSNGTLYINASASFQQIKESIEADSVASKLISVDFTGASNSNFIAESGYTKVQNLSGGEGLTGGREAQSFIRLDSTLDTGLLVKAKETGDDSNGIEFILRQRGGLDEDSVDVFGNKIIVNMNNSGPGTATVFGAIFSTTAGVAVSIDANIQGTYASKFNFKIENDVALIGGGGVSYDSSINLITITISNTGTSANDLKSVIDGSTAILDTETGLTVGDLFTLNVGAGGTSTLANAGSAFGGAFGVSLVDDYFSGAAGGAVIGSNAQSNTSAYGIIQLIRQNATANALVDVDFFTRSGSSIALSTAATIAGNSLDANASGNTVGIQDATHVFGDYQFTLTGGYDGEVSTNSVTQKGADGEVEVNGVSTAAQNLAFTFDNGDVRGTITLNESFNASGNSSTFELSSKGAFFQIGQKAQLSYQTGIALGNISSNALGEGLYFNSSFDTSISESSSNTRRVVGTLADISSGSNFDLAKDATTAVNIIDAAIQDVSILRGRVGAFISNTLDSNINSLGVAFENLTAAESRIRDIDFAAETANFTRAQILVQAGTSIAAQANVATQAALQLLG